MIQLTLTEKINKKMNKGDTFEANLRICVTVSDNESIVFDIGFQVSDKIYA